MNSKEAKSVFELVLFTDGQHQRSSQAAKSAAAALEVNVLCTGMPATVKAIDSAAELARGLNARLHLLVAQVVPYAVPLESPPVLVEFQEALFRDMRGVMAWKPMSISSSAGTRGDVRCGSSAPRSVVVLGARRRMVASRETLARRCAARATRSLCVYEEEGNHHA